MRTFHASHGAEYRISIALPEGDPPAEGFPVVYLLDANADFATLVEASRRGSARQGSTGIAPAVVVGIGYPIDGPYDRARRLLDYTPGPAVDGAHGGATGGAAGFLTFLQDELKPMVERDFAIDRRRQTLFGHSLAGLFSLWTMTRRPEAFQTYVAISPSIWWDEPLLRTGLGALADHAANGSTIRLMICVGQWEEALAPWQGDVADRPAMEARRQARGMIRRARDFARDVEAAGQGRVKVMFEELAGQDHSSAVPASVSACLRFALRR